MCDLCQCQANRVCDHPTTGSSGVFNVYHYKGNRVIVITISQKEVAARVSGCVSTIKMLLKIWIQILNNNYKIDVLKITGQFYG